jgi:hypothetical protein
MHKKWMHEGLVTDLSCYSSSPSSYPFLHGRCNSNCSGLSRSSHTMASRIRNIFA